jgi:hypothetical protein
MIERMNRLTVKSPVVNCLSLLLSMIPNGFHRASELNEALRRQSQTRSMKKSSSCVFASPGEIAARKSQVQNTRRTAAFKRRTVFRRGADSTRKFAHCRLSEKCFR